MKKYLIFAGDIYYPLGGIDDFIIDYSDKEGAINKAEELIENNIHEWVQVYAVHTGKTILRLYSSESL